MHGMFRTLAVTAVIATMTGQRLMKCEYGPFYRTAFSIGHRGAALQFPEYTKEAYQAGAHVAAGIVERDTTVTKDGELVCRRAECGRYTTTHSVASPLNAKCSVPWSGPGSIPKCRPRDRTLSEFKTLEGKIDAGNPAATVAEGDLWGYGEQTEGCPCRSMPDPAQFAGLARYLHKKVTVCTLLCHRNAMGFLCAMGSTWWISSR